MKNFVHAPLDANLLQMLGTPIPAPQIGRSAVHKEVREVARAAAGELYENVMSNNDIFERWKKQNPGASRKELERRFIAKNWSRCIPFARATMAHLLTLSTVDSTTKERIIDVLVKDQQLRVGRTPATQLLEVKGA
jgi:hypothetical protein